MSGPDLPPDLPPEYAEAYRRGYQRAWTTSHGEPAVPDQREPLDDFFANVERAPWEGPTHRDESAPVREGWFMPVMFGFLALALVLGSYGLGLLFSGSGDSPAGGELRVNETSLPTLKPKPVEGQAWEGEIRTVTDLRAESSCVLPSSEDAAGRPVSYLAGKAVDGDFSTAWRCAGDGRGVTLQVALGDIVTLGEVGLVPGYAKTDPQSGADRYAENNRLTKVRWTFADGRSVVQRLDGSADNRDVQTVRIPPVETDSLILEVLESTPGPRNTVAVSELALGETS